MFFYVILLIFLFWSVIICLFILQISNNPIHSLLSLLLIFLFISILQLFLGIEFLAILILMIYLGAIAVLFIFTLLMLDIKIIEIYYYYINHFYFIFFMFFIFLVYFIFIYKDIYILIPNYFDNLYTNWFHLIFLYYNINLFSLLYILNSLEFIISGFILLSSMMGCVVLTSNITKKKIINIYGLSFKKKFLFFFL